MQVSTLDYKSFLILFSFNSMLYFNGFVVKILLLSQNCIFYMKFKIILPSSKKKIGILTDIALHLVSVGHIMRPSLPKTWSVSLFHSFLYPFKCLFII